MGGRGSSSGTDRRTSAGRTWQTQAERSNRRHVQHPETTDKKKKQNKEKKKKRKKKKKNNLVYSLINRL